MNEGVGLKVHQLNRLIDFDALSLRYSVTCASGE